MFEDIGRRRHEQALAIIDGAKCAIDRTVAELAHGAGRLPCFGKYVNTKSVLALQAAGKKQQNCRRPPAFCSLTIAATGADALLLTIAFLLRFL